MGSLYLVRHGQASFGAADYDQLSAKGHEQCRRLGAYWRERGQRFDAVFTGTLRRHAQSLAGIVEGYGEGLPAVALPGLNEYDSEAVVRAIHPGPLGKPSDPETVKQHFRLLRQGLLAWMRGETAPVGMPAHADFAAGVADVLARVLALGVGRHVLIVSSGGPISTAVGQVLDTPPETVVELNLRIRNSALTEFAFNPKRHHLVTFNALPHLDTAEARGLMTHA
ncbi:histidine phosphatase family protein [Pelomonas aquatica]|jgi:broad specificity phosphatase PhoE|uniref:Histidine phosphatase family protein n=1 Tax=Pelomonas aquatica TaxID=431058 RepID=A0A9X4LKZ7_9BURK|nr:histidine phosphatase family protein [Pelomonas aquatica]MCY4753471.1 histidine phosphatase family protein [Pelomonas aquatica]MDG0864739.1 histidine phosphatase family protein [Pelomonas aquatica]